MLLKLTVNKWLHYFTTIMDRQHNVYVFWFYAFSEKGWIYLSSVSTILVISEKPKYLCIVVTFDYKCYVCIKLHIHNIYWININSHSNVLATVLLKWSQIILLQYLEKQHIKTTSGNHIILIPFQSLPNCSVLS